jgi:hypothetical protein
MDSREQAVPSSIAEIKRGMDPAFSYIIFEKIAGPGRDGGFSDIERIISGFPDLKRQWRLYQDQSAGKILLVVRMGQKTVEPVLEKLLACELCRDVSFSVYNRWPLKESE